MLFENFMDCKKSIKHFTYKLTFDFLFHTSIYFGILFSIKVLLYRRDIPFQPRENTGVIPTEHVGSKFTSEVSRKVYIGHTWIKLVFMPSTESRFSRRPYKVDFSRQACKNPIFKPGM